MCGNLTGQAAVTTHDDPLANSLGPRNPQLARQAYRAANRLSPEGRAALSGIALRRDDLSAAVAALRALPRGAGAAAVGAAMAPFRTTALDAAVFLAREPRDLRGRPFAAQLLCSFCDRPRDELRKFVSGPSVYICEDCVRWAAAALSATDPVAQAHEPRAGRERCSFCGKASGIDASPGGGVRLLRGPRVTICHECVALCLAIFHDTRDEKESQAERLQHWVQQLSSPHHFVRCLAAVVLGDRNLPLDPVARRALVAALDDTDWRVRALAEATLHKIGALPDGYHLSFVGRLPSLDFMHVALAGHASEVEVERRKR
jgi:hypothetical protein